MIGGKEVCPREMRCCRMCWSLTKRVGLVVWSVMSLVEVQFAILSLLSSLEQTDRKTYVTT